MNVFLGYAVEPFDAPIAARLRAVAAAYDISILLPDRSLGFTNGVQIDTQHKIRLSDAVIALITRNAPPYLIQVVNQELLLAESWRKPIIALIEQGMQIQGIPQTQIVYFNRLQPSAHEAALFAALKNIRQDQQWKQNLTALGWIAGIALGLVALSELLSEKK